VGVRSLGTEVIDNCGLLLPCSIWNPGLPEEPTLLLTAEQIKKCGVSEAKLCICGTSRAARG